MSQAISISSRGLPKVYRVSANTIQPALRTMLGPSGAVGAVGGPVVIYDRATSQRIDELLVQVSALNERIKQVEGAIQQVNELLVIEVRDVSDRVAKREIKAYYAEHHGETLYPDEVATVLELDVSQVVRLCRVLAEEGEIGEAKETNET